ncbi:PEP-CTERM sorting domain-containing protein [Gloeothece verrucosa]|uniref:Coagulation factor 5/8 type domain protein n=1 Tax=Gloeothece verrucosa (strain PCC 7822) TaxID=497965 RepID=E0UN53_GLOV7|nr:PEP-CTERM sorting domain-containing protein [Gloeothece verrucosa]ADN18383.1 conserved hypothetical protein [Gloeothece verrucosa PCC 7822]
MKLSLFAITTATLTLGIMGIAQAGTIVVPNFVSTTLSTNPSAGVALNNIINQSGLSVGYTAGADFDAYLASNPTHKGGSATSFFTGTGSIKGSITFDFGTATTLESLAIWNISGILAPQGVSLRDFSLQASSTSDFSSPITLGSFTVPRPTADPTPNNGVFTFTPTTARFFRLNTLTNYGSSIVGLGEIVFEQSQDIRSIPEPLTLLGVGTAVGFSTLFKQTRNKMQKHR